MSFGKYKINEAQLLNCGDKGISLGEKSILHLNNATINNANIGFASKDSSIANINDIKTNSNICLAAYRKKQEFSGAIISYNSLTCEKKNQQIQKGSVIKKNEF